MGKRVDPPKEVETADTVEEGQFLIYELSKPIMSYGEEVNQIKMREPTGNDILAVGDPVLIYMYEDPVRIEYDYKKVVAMAARLSGIPSTSIAKITSRELKGLAMTMSPFFTPA